MVFIALAAEAVLLLLRVPLERDLNGDGNVDASDVTILITLISKS